MRVNATALPPNTHLVRVLVGDGPEYDRMIVVTEEQGGEMLFLQGWIGHLPTRHQWLVVRDAEFPRARRVRWIRRTNGRERKVVVSIPT